MADIVCWNIEIRSQLVRGSTSTSGVHGKCTYVPCEVRITSIGGGLASGALDSTAVDRRKVGCICGTVL